MLVVFRDVVLLLVVVFMVVEVVGIVVFRLVVVGIVVFRLVVLVVVFIVVEVVGTVLFVLFTSWKRTSWCVTMLVCVGRNSAICTAPIAASNETITNGTTVYKFLPNKPPRLMCRNVN